MAILQVPQKLTGATAVLFPIIKKHTFKNYSHHKKRNILLVFISNYFIVIIKVTTLKCKEGIYWHTHKANNGKLLLNYIYFKAGVWVYCRSVCE